MKTVLRFNDFHPVNTDAEPLEFILNAMANFDEKGYTKFDLVDMTVSQNGAHEGIFDIAVHCYFRRKFPELASIIDVTHQLSRLRCSLSAAHYASVVDFVIDPTSAELTAEACDPPAIAFAPNSNPKKYLFESDKSMGNPTFSLPRALYRASMLANPELQNSVIVLKASRSEVLRAGVFDNETHNLIKCPRRRTSLYVYAKPYTATSAFADFIAQLDSDPDFEFGRPKLILVDAVAYEETLKALPNKQDYNDLVSY